LWIATLETGIPRLGIRLGLENGTATAGIGIGPETRRGRLVMGTARLRIEVLA
jgi:hypothetical protein